MNEKQLDSSQTDTKKSMLSKRNIAAALGGLVVYTEAAVGVVHTVEMPKPTPEKIMTAVARSNVGLFKFTTRQEMCPPATNPADIAPLLNAVGNPLADADSIARYYNLERVDLQKMVEIFPELHNASSATEVTTIVNGFTQPQMGLTIHADQVHNDTNIEVTEYKERIIKFLEIMKEVPVSLLKQMQIEDIKIRTEDANVSKLAGQYHHIFNQVDLNFDYLDSPKTIIHELLGHGVHDTVCQGTYWNDPTFQATNPPEYKYTNEHWPGAQYHTDHHVDQYATSNVSEDYASTTALYFTAGFQPNLRDEANTLDNKVTIILDRLNSLVPGSAEYLSCNIPLFEYLEQKHAERRKHKRSAQK